MGIGQQELGRELLQVQLTNIGKMDPDDLNWSHKRDIAKCYSLAGETDRAMDMLQDMIENNTGYLQYWYRDRDSALWGPLEDDSRFQLLIARIEGMLAEQRALLDKMVLANPEF